ncbi:2430_t:CDS:10 [Acaulospora colombiana]|uniref:2430_t:CDS:1 n=1 Tax=Acaulospora colombiana TaxID=27376 RepID=A0ACA9MN49_9GLOM|nr:2430_t:CDS:10 [Acaulospora colombiana]
MSLSAVERTPVEIWDLILRCAVTMPFLPFTERGVLSAHLADNFNMISSMCPIDLMRLDAQTTNIQANINSTIYSYISVYLAYQPQEASSGRVDDDARIPRVNVLILGPLTTRSLRALKPHSNLVVLSIGFSPEIPATWSMEELSTCAPRLSHLHLEDVHKNLRLLSNQLVHSNLRYLSLLTTSWGEHDSPINWTFPSLQTLVIHGKLHRPSHKVINDFISRHGKGLTGLDIGYRLSGEDYLTLGDLPPTLWDTCPHLSVFGMDAFNIFTDFKFELLRKARDKDNSPSIELLLHKLSEYPQRLYQPTRFLQGLKDRWNVTNFIHPSPWAEQISLKEIQSLGRPKNAVQSISSPPQTSPSRPWNAPKYRTHHLIQSYVTKLIRFRVPLDYADSSKGTIRLQMARIPASQQPSRGGIFFNPGGPGGSGVINIAQVGSDFVEKWGADWDYISWDPRGIWASEPFIKDLTPAEKMDIWGETIHPGQYEVDTQEFIAGAKLRLSIKGCKSSTRHSRARMFSCIDDSCSISTTSNVRDIVSMADALYGSDKDINYYGISYGTYMGMIFTQMFPNRVGKVIIDGVANPQANSQYLPILGADEQYGDANAVLEGFYNTCALAGPSKCAVAERYPTPEGIKGALDQMLGATYKNWNDGNGGLSYNQFAQQAIFANLYYPSWPKTAQAIVLGLNGSLSESAAMLKTIPEENRFKLPLVSSTPAYSGSIWKRDLDKRQFNANYYGCSDTPEVNPEIVTTERVMEEKIRISRTVWPIAASLHYADHFCHRYTSRGVERYSGPWDVQPKNVVLVIGNQADPSTPFRNAQLVTRLLGSKARLVQQAGYGHTTCKYLLSLSSSETETNFGVQLL